METTDRLIKSTKKLEKENREILKQFEKLDNRTNTFLSISLGIFSLQVTLLTNTILNIYRYIQEQNILLLSIFIIFIANILFNITSITKFRKSTKISEKIYLNQYINEFNDKLEENEIIEREIIDYQNNIYENKIKIGYKKKYINNGLNNIIISMIIIVILILILLLVIKQ